ncbi:hypothetical protein AK830_g12657 [Neonectria ditissima]|uniref:Cyanovirin-N domain-containing protein n=1 Tax=Neonectria ditissima TaxID=78410 RepID=A0A0P7B502_9HYPO|nr:hypothetical protein AK830_g12657 [Neonectria ditissima]
MWRYLIPLFLHRAHALPATGNATCACPHDALYTSLISSGTAFCSSVIKDGHCGGGYSTPSVYMTYNQTQISSYCRCILTSSDATATLGSGMVTTGDPTVTSGDAASETAVESAGLTSSLDSASASGQSSANTSGTPVGRPGSGRPSGSSDAGSLSSPTQPASSAGSTGNETMPMSSTRSGSEATTSGVVGPSANSTLTWSRTLNSEVSSAPAGNTSMSVSLEPSVSASSLTGSSFNVSSTFHASSGTRNATSASMETETTLSRIGSLTASESGVTATAASDTGSMSGTSSGDISASGGSTMTLPTDDTSSTFPNPISTTGLTETTATTASNSQFANSTSSQLGNATATGAPEFPAANFTQVTRTAALAQETCYSLTRDSGDDPTRRALLRNARLREDNASIPVPYIESVHFESSGVDPLYLTVRDEAEETFFVDVSNRNRISISDRRGNSVVLDAHGIHFSTPNCMYGVCIKVNNFLQQLARLAGVECAATRREKRIDDLEFTQILNLHDQCGNPVDRSLRQYPQLRVGPSTCTDTSVDKETGQWQFDCTFPGSLSGAARCELAIKNDVVDFLLTDPFGGSCPDLATVVTTLEATGRDFLNFESFQTALREQRLDKTQMREADAAAAAFEQLWEALQQLLSKRRGEPSRDSSALEDYIDVYRTYRNLENDICEDLHDGEIPLNLSLVAGVTRIDAITSFNFAPVSPRAYNVTVQDPSQVACCPNGAVAVRDGDACAYPGEAVVAGTSCICGTTVGGAAVAFEYAECDNFVGDCAVDADCVEAGFDGFVCLTGSCCQGGVCVDPYACSQNGTELVKFGGV